MFTFESVLKGLIIVTVIYLIILFTIRFASKSGNKSIYKTELDQLKEQVEFYKKQAEYYKYLYESSRKN